MKNKTAETDLSTVYTVMNSKIIGVGISLDMGDKTHFRENNNNSVIIRCTSLRKITWVREMALVSGVFALRDMHVKMESDWKPAQRCSLEL